MFFPAYNDSGTIASLVITAIRTARTPHPRTTKSSSSTTAAPTGPRTSSTSSRGSIRNSAWSTIPKNRGYGGALQTGFADGHVASWCSIRTATRNTIRQRWQLLWRRMADDVDLVNGYKISRSDPLHRILIGRIYHHLVSLLFGLKVRDVDCDFRLMRRSIFDTVHLERNSGVICLEMMKKIQDAGFRIAEVPVHHYHRAYGKSQFFNFARLYKTAIDVMALWRALVIRREHMVAADHPLPAVPVAGHSKDRP